MIHFAIGVPNQDVHGDRLRRIEDGQAQADTDRFGHLRQPNAGKRRIEPDQALLPSLQWALRQDRGKFISAYSKHHIDLSKRLDHDIPDRRENLISGLVTMLIVDRFEPVHIAHHQTESFAGPVGLRHFVREHLFERAPIFQSGHGVLAALIGQGSMLIQNPRSGFDARP